MEHRMTVMDYVFGHTQETEHGRVLLVKLPRSVDLFLD